MVTNLNNSSIRVQHFIDRHNQLKLKIVNIIK